MKYIKNTLFLIKNVLNNGKHSIIRETERSSTGVCDSNRLYKYSVDGREEDNHFFNGNYKHINNAVYAPLIYRFLFDSYFIFIAFVRYHIQDGKTNEDLDENYNAEKWDGLDIPHFEYRNENVNNWCDGNPYEDNNPSKFKNSIDILKKDHFNSEYQDKE